MLVVKMGEKFMAGNPLPYANIFASCKDISRIMRIDFCTNYFMPLNLKGFFCGMPFALCVGPNGKFTIPSKETRFCDLCTLSWWWSCALVSFLLQICVGHASAISRI